MLFGGTQHSQRWLHSAGAAALLTQPAAKAGLQSLRAQSRPQAPALLPEDVWSGTEQAGEEVVVPPEEPQSCQQFWDLGGACLVRGHL